MEIFLHEGDGAAAWAEAKAGGCSRGPRLALAKRRKAAHPDEVKIDYIAALLRNTGDWVYEGAIRYLQKIEALMQRSQQFGAFAAVVGDMRACVMLDGKGRAIDQVLTNTSCIVSCSSLKDVDQNSRMAEQLSLAGFDVASQPTDRAFFAIFPDADAAARIAQLAQRLRSENGLTGRPLAKERFHVTLHHLGDYVGLPQGIVTAAREAAATIAVAPFDIVFDHVASFSGRARNLPFVLRGGDGLVALTAFQNALGVAMQKSGLGRWAKPQFTPHLTLLYDDRCVAEQVVEEIAWTAREFVLVHSLLGRTRHVPLASWPLHS